MNNEYISSKGIVSQIIREFGITSHTNKLDMIEYVGDAIEFIGYGLGFEVLYSTSTIEDFKISKPKDMIRLYNVFYKGRTLRNANRGVEKVNSTWRYLEDYALESLQDEIVSRINAANKRCDLPSCIVQTNPCENREGLIEDVLKIHEGRKEIERIGQLSYTQKDWYKNTHSCIKTNLDKGDVTIQYLSHAKDEEGFPLIHNAPRYKEFIKYYVMKILLQSGVKHPVLTFRDMLELTERAQARAINEELRLNSSQITSLINSWVGGRR